MSDMSRPFAFEGSSINKRPRQRDRSRVTRPKPGSTERLGLGALKGD